MSEMIERVARALFESEYPGGEGDEFRWERSQDGYRTMARAAIEAMQMSWQPMETAPMDGTEVDLWTQWGRVTGCSWKHHRWRNGKPDGEKSWFDARWQDGPQPEPTHWMLPPSPPV